MYRGTTPTNAFTTALDLSDADVIYITYKQDGAVVIEKTKDDITFGTTDDDRYTLTIGLTQEETLAFSTSTVYIQIRARFSDGRVVASNVVPATVQQILKEGVI